jgi:hypothetical protein
VVPAAVVPLQLLRVAPPLARRTLLENIVSSARMMRAAPEVLEVCHVSAARASAYTIIAQRKSRPTNFIDTRSRRAP